MVISASLACSLFQFGLVGFLLIFLVLKEGFILELSIWQEVQVTLYPSPLS